MPVRTVCKGAIQIKGKDDMPMWFVMSEGRHIARDMKDKMRRCHVMEGNYTNPCLKKDGVV